MRKLISLFLALMLTVQPITVFASENSSNSDVLLIVTPQIFSAIVPTQLPVWMSADGVISVAEDTMISNLSMGPIRIDRIELTNVKSDWELVSFNDDFNGFKVGSKKLAMLFNGDKSLASGNIPLGTINLAPIDGLGSMPLNYDAKIPAQNMGLVDEIPANIVFTLKWYEVGSASIEENNPNAYEFVPADTKILTINFKGVTADDDSVAWSSSNEAVATVADYVSRGRARPIDGSKQCIVTAVGSGNAIITGTLKDGTTNSFEVVVSNKDVASLEITKAPDKVNYIEGENFSSAGMVVTANYNNGTSSNISDYTVTDGTNLVISQESVAISYGDKTMNQAINVVAESLTKIAITTPPNNTRYVEGNDFDYTNMIVTAYYNNGINRIVAPTLSRNTNLFVGQTSIDVSFDGITVTQDITVSVKTLTNIAITSPPTQTSYIEANNFDSTGMIVTATYNNGTTGIVTPTFARNTNLATGQTSIDVNFDGKTVTQDITVSAKTLISISITTPPTKKAYIEGNAFDKTGMVVTATYNNGTTAVVTPTLSRNTNLVIGQTNVDVSFGGKTVIQAITVATKTLASIAITTQPTKKAYIEANNFDATGMVVTATYNNGTTATVTPTFGRNTALTVGQTSVDVSFGGKTATQAITVVAKTLMGIAITTPPTKTTYAHWDNFDKTGMVVTASYNNGTTGVITGWTISDGTNLVSGKTSVTINYRGQTTTQAIRVNHIAYGTKYIEGNYEYSYSEELNYFDDWSPTYGIQQGWGVRLIDKTQTDYLSPLTAIQGYPVTNMTRLFSQTQNTILNLIDWDTSNITDMSIMFNNCSAKIINGLSNFDTSKVTNMYSMFASSQLTSLDLSSFNTSKVTDMQVMFYNSQATSINGLNNFNTSKVTSMYSMFNGSQATSLDLSSFNTSNVIEFYEMFSQSQATSLDLSSFDTSKVTNIGSMFYKSQATSIDLSNWNLPLINKSGGADVLSTLGIKSLPNLKTLSLKNWIAPNITNMSNMFYESPIINLDLSGFDTSKVTNMGNMFAKSQASNLSLSSFDTSRVTNMASMFNGSRATSLDVSSFNTSNVTDMWDMFRDSQATSLDLSSFDTSKVINMSSMFINSQATSLDLSSFNTAKVTNMSKMFQGSKVTSLNLNNFDVRNVTNMTDMFWSTQVANINLSNFVTSSLVTMNGMFSDTIATTIAIPKFDTSKVSTLERAFYNSRATNLDLSSFDVSNATNVSNMFGWSNVKSLIVKNQAASEKYKASSGFPSGITITIKT